MIRRLILLAGKGAVQKSDEERDVQLYESKVE